MDELDEVFAGFGDDLKVAALATRAEPRDYIDVAAALRVRTPDQLGRLAQQADPAVTEADLCEAMVAARPS